ncbi:MAG: hypothetical protein CSA34_04095 [Desulfobulbus propionicus]|nr:MAG: hypothetical protein CSA34_04095 [Desulfobulbus propionicus]
MNLLIPLLGKTRERYLAQGITDYSTRLRRYLSVEMPVLKERTAHSAPPQEVIATGSAILLERAAAADYLVALDLRGTMMGSEELAKMLKDLEERGVQQLCFLIGGHLGLSSAVLQRANFCLSLSPMTFTHELSRLLLLEQLYRACSITAGHKYHR